MALYHRGIPCIILLDIKMGKLDSRDIGQMNKYIGYWRRHKQYEHEKDTIGLIICREAGGKRSCTPSMAWKRKSSLPSTR